MTRFLKSKKHVTLVMTIFLCLYLLSIGYGMNKILNYGSFSVDHIKNFEKEQMKQFSKFNDLYYNYIKKHNKAIENLLKLNPDYITNSTNLPKVVVVKPHTKTGLGNRFPGIVCGFLYSIITDRLFFINGYEDFHDYFEKDFEHNWEKVAHLYKDRKNKSLHNILRNDFTLITRGNLNSDYVNSFDILNVHTWDYACAPIMSNPNHKEWIKEIIPDYKIFTVISQKLLRLKSDIQRQVENFMINHFGEYNIGIHLRMKKATRKTKGWIIPIDHYCRVVETLLIGIKNNVSIFIAADENKSRDTLISCIQNSITSNHQEFVKIVYINNNMSLVNPNNRNPGTELGSLIDMKILSLCDDLILTFGSTFGFVAAGWSYRSFRRLRGPLVVMPRNTTDDFASDKIWLWQAGSNEPCMYLGKVLIRDSDPETVEVFKTNPFWMYYSQGCP